MELSNALWHGKNRHGFTISSKLWMQMVVLVMAAMVCIGGNEKISVHAATKPAAELAPAPAPVPPPFENVTQSLVYGGNYEAFIALLAETNLDVEFQGMANNTEGPGVTIFAPTDVAFSSKLVKSLLQNLTASQKMTLVKYHALGRYQAFKNLQNSNNNQTTTLAGYQVNITFTGGGRLQITSGWSVALLSTTIYSHSPVSMFAIDHVLLPDEIFGLPPPPPPPSPPPPVRSPPPPTPSTSSPLKSPSSSGYSLSSPLYTLSISYLFMSLVLYKILGIQFF